MTAPVSFNEICVFLEGGEVDKLDVLRCNFLNLNDLMKIAKFLLDDKPAKAKEIKSTIQTISTENPILKTERSIEQVLHDCQDSERPQLQQLNERAKITQFRSIIEECPEALQTSLSHKTVSHIPSKKHSGKQGGCNIL